MSYCRDVKGSDEHDDGEKASGNWPDIIYFNDGMCVVLVAKARG